MSGVKKFGKKKNKIQFITISNVTLIKIFNLELLYHLDMSNLCSNEPHKTTSQKS